MNDSDLDSNDLTSRRQEERAYYLTREALLQFLELLNKLHVTPFNGINTEFRDLEDGFIFAHCLNKM
jgi:hypothetical protein